MAGFKIKIISCIEAFGQRLLAVTLVLFVVSPAMFISSSTGRNSEKGQEKRS